MGQSVSIDLTELTKLENWIDRVSASFEKARAVREEMEDIAVDMRNFIIDGMTNTRKSSKGYKRGNKTHFPSRPGSMPARDSGELISRITYDAFADQIEVGVEAGAPYSVYLEDGTRKMEARPFLEPTVDHFEPFIEMRLWNKIKGVTA